ncbi:hypothetical protein MXAZACID_05396 [Acidocella sp. MX-AZ02]|nr:hypothetical protein MXAZACID_05396 [Acidocella sp. MX-AZ02]
MAALEEAHWWFVGRRHVLDAVIRSLNFPSEARILELGSGTGGNFSMLSQFGHVTAVERDEAARDYASRRPEKVALFAGALPDDIPFTDQRFDLVCLLDVLEHVEDDLGTLRRVASLLVPRGKAVITVPAYQFLYGPHDLQLHHKRRYGAAQLRGLLQQAGLQPRMFGFMNSALLPLACIARIIDKLPGRKSSLGRTPPGVILNTLLTHIFGFEAKLVGRMSLPFGLSLLTIVEPIPGEVARSEQEVLKCA